MGARFVGSIHEYMTDTTPGAIRVDTHLEILNFKKSRSIERNVRGLLKEWKKTHTVRTAFYMSMSMADLGRKEDADEWRRIVIAEFPDDRSEERFRTMENTCEAYYTAKDWESLGELAIDMMNQFPVRAEGFFYRYIYNFNTGKYSLAFTDANIDPVPVHPAALHPTDTETTLELNVPLAEVVADITARMLQSSGYEVSVCKSCWASTSDSPNRASRIDVTIGWHVSDGQTNDDPVKKAMTETLTGGNNNKTISTDVFIGSVLA
jgi:hypothetical protein